MDLASWTMCAFLLQWVNMLDFIEEKIPKNLFIYLFIQQLFNKCMLYARRWWYICEHITNQNPCPYGMLYWRRHKEMNK